MWPRAVHVRYAHLHHRRKKGLSLWARLSPSMNTVSTVERSEARQNTCLQWMPEDFDVLMRGCGACITCSGWPSTFCGGRMKTPSARSLRSRVKPYWVSSLIILKHGQERRAKTFPLLQCCHVTAGVATVALTEAFHHEKHVLARSTRRALAMKVPRCCGLFMESWR